LRDIAQNAPLIMQVFEENLMLKEKIREFEVNDVESSEYNIREKIEVNMIFLTEVSRKLDESIRERQFLDERLERMAYLLGITPQDLISKKPNLEEIQEMTSKIEHLNFEVLRNKQLKDDLEAQMTTLRAQNLNLSQNVNQLELEKERTAANYEARIKDLKDSFEKDKHGIEDNLKSELIDTKDQLEAYKRICEDFEAQSRYKDNQYSIAIKQKDDVLNFNQSVIKELKEENQTLLNRNLHLETLLKKESSVIDNLSSEKQKLTEKVAELIRSYNSLEENLDKVLKEKYDLQGQIREFKESQLDKFELENALKRIKCLETDVQREILEKEKIQDELETVQESYSYVLNEMATLHRKSARTIDLHEPESHYNTRGHSKTHKEVKPIDKNPKSLVSGLQSIIESEFDEKSRLKSEMSTLSQSISTLKGEENVLKQEIKSLKEGILLSYRPFEVQQEAHTG
jgi:chromosome segregation ATPase